MESVLIRFRGGLGLIRLNRPSVLNALNLDMVERLLETLTAWLTDDEVTCVVITGEGDRAFCAGGDLQADAAQADRFLRTEYRLNALIAEYPKPIVTILHGLVLGGGVGVGCHAGVRIVTEGSRIGMPETRIGICPDVGGTALLERAPRRIGRHLAVTAGTMSAAQAIAYGFADAYLPKEALAGVVPALMNRREMSVEQVIAGLAGEPEADEEIPSWVEYGYDADDVRTVLARLDGGGVSERTAAARIREMCPTAVAVTWEALALVESGESLRVTLQREYDLIRALARRPDIAEGIRARLVDRDTPHWSPASIDQVDHHEVASILASRGAPLEFTDVAVVSYRRSRSAA